MRFLDYSMAAARRCRLALRAARLDEHGIDPDPVLRAEHLWEDDAPAFPIDELLACILASIDAAGVDLEVDSGGMLRGAQACLSLTEGLLLYDPVLDGAERRHDRLLVFAHEFGHVKQHRNLFDRVDGTSSLLQPGAWGNPAASAARYSRKAREEAEANAFAAELVCPAGAVFDVWRRNPGWTAQTIAERLDLPVDLVRVQLAEGLRRYVRDGGVVPVEEAEEALGRPRTRNAKQDDAVRTLGRPVLVNAGPGTGKTATLVERIGFLLTPGADGRPVAAPHDILALTFTNEAADELRQRVERRHGRDAAAQMTLATFHGFGAQLLHRYGESVALGPEMRILDTAAQEELLLRVLGTTSCPRLLTLRDPRETVVEVLGHISHLKNGLCTPDDLAEAVARWCPADPEAEHARACALELVELYRAYEAAKRGGDDEPGAVDFGDLILLPYQILRDQESVREEVRRTHRWVLLDEYQDVGRSIARLLQQLCGPRNPPWAVGDARQSIHRFRGAAPENVAEFARDFAHLGEVHEVNLEINYRSSAGIVTCANQLATLMADPAHEGPGFQEHWRPGPDAMADEEPVIRVAEANCDEAERHHIVEQVQAWLANDGVRPRQIAVLARRNRDVRQIGLGLRAAGVPIAAGGVVTAEGAGGDLAACVALVDSARAALPRLVFALGRARGAGPEVINRVIRHLMGAEEETGLDAGADALVSGVERVRSALGDMRFHADAWTVFVAFLFDASDYLRRHLEGAGPEADLALEEVVTALSLAAGHRFARGKTDPAESRMQFVESYRRTLVSPTAAVDAERTRRDAVRVMTCHAAKGLQFPYVILSGQTGRAGSSGDGSAPDAGAESAPAAGPARGSKPAPPKQPKPRYAWLPHELQPDPRAEREQEDALLFVGVTRAERQVVVSYAATANDRERSGRRRVVGLLERWMETFYSQEPEPWVLPATPAQTFGVSHVWGGDHRASIRVRHLADSECALRTYLEDVLAMRFRVVPDPLYPEFFGRVRSAIGAITERVRTTGVPVAQEDAESLFDAAWPASEHDGHPHLDLYRPLGRKAVLGFVAACSPSGTGWKPLSAAAAEGSIALDLVAYAEDPSGRPVALGFRPESLEELSKDGKTIPWGKLTGAKRLSFALLAAERADLQAQVYSGQDGRIYDYAINPRYLDGAVKKATERHAGLRSQTWIQPLVERTCDRCPIRISCPYWLGLLGGVATPRP